jgi:GNAT superfamily N-acetyltransferase
MSLKLDNYLAPYERYFVHLNIKVKSQFKKLGLGKQVLTVLKTYAETYNKEIRMTISTYAMPYDKLSAIYKMLDFEIEKNKCVWKSR